MSRCHGLPSPSLWSHNTIHCNRHQEVASLGAFQPPWVIASASLNTLASSGTPKGSWRILNQRLMDTPTTGFYSNRQLILVNFGGHCSQRTRPGSTAGIVSCTSWINAMEGSPVSRPEEAWSFGTVHASMDTNWLRLWEVSLIDGQ